MNASLPRPSILVTDDIKANRFAIKRALKSIDVDIVEASSGSETLARALNNECLALILLDIQMPVMNGYEVAQLLKSEKQTKNLPIIFLTAAYKDEQHERQGYLSGGIDYIEKPFDKDILCSKVNMFIELHQHNQGLQRKYDQLTNDYNGLKIDVRDWIKTEHNSTQLSKKGVQDPTSTVIDIGTDINFISHQEPSNFKAVIRQKSLENNMGLVRRMSNNGIYIELSCTQEYKPNMLLDTKIIGDGWDSTMPPLAMRVSNVDEGGIALEFTDSAKHIESFLK